MELNKSTFFNKEKQIKEDELLTKDITEIYKELLRGDRKRFPKGIWQRPDALDNAKKCIKYLIEDRLKFTDEEIKNNLSINLFADNNLGGMLLKCFNNSPFEAINSVYPNKFKPWEFNVPQSYWNEQTAVEALKWLLEEKLKWSDEEIKEKLSVRLFDDNGLHTPIYKLFDASPFKAINAAYPNKFKPWDLKSVSRNFWDSDYNCRNAIKWLIEEKLKLTDEEIKNQLSGDLFIENNLRGMLNIRFKGSPFEAINFAYPNKFKKEDFRSYKRGWNKK